MLLEASATRSNLDVAAGAAGLPRSIRFHDLARYFASLLIADGLDVKTAQTRLCHASAKTTRDVYEHLWPDKGRGHPSPAESVRNRS